MRLRQGINLLKVKINVELFINVECAGNIAIALPAHSNLLLSIFSEHVLVRDPRDGHPVWAVYRGASLSVAFRRGSVRGEALAEWGRGLRELPYSHRIHSGPIRRRDVASSHIRSEREGMGVW